VIGWIVTLLAAIVHVAAWSTPGSPLCAALGWSSIALFISALLIPTARLKRFFVAGCITYVGGFYWLYSTIKDFGGFPTFAAIAIYALFVAGSAVQFLIWAFSFQHLPHWMGKAGLRAAVAWLVAHHFWIKIFPWDFGHTQLAFLPFAQLAQLAGVTGITFLMMWASEVCVARKTTTLGAKVVAILALGGSLMFGKTTEISFNEATASRGAPLQTYLVQGNVSLHHKHDVTYFTVNREQYLTLSAKALGHAGLDSLVIWPESTITDFIPASTRDASTSKVLPFLNNGAAFLVGALTYSSRTEYHNSSVLVRPDGSVAEPYHKMILMPFGEYTPLSSVLPFLKDINSTAGQFTAGAEPAVLSFPLSNGSEVKLSPLICYEDIVPSIARDAVNKGAELLINQTNDAWFGDTVAPYQHHIIAAFRAIENDRYLLRSTNTGLTAVVDPLGRTLASLLPYTEGILPMQVSLRNTQTVFTRFPVPFMWLIAAALSVIAIIRRVKKS
jgi:apolipoprotein N-acyltransferase